MQRNAAQCDAVRRNATIAALFITILLVTRMASKSTASLALFVKLTISAFYFSPLSELVKARILTFRLLFLYILVRRKANPQILPAFDRMLEVQSLSPTQLAVEVALIYLFWLFLSSRCCIIGFRHYIVTIF